MTQATQLEIETLKQDAYMTIQDALKTMSPNDGNIFKDPGSDEAMTACDEWNTIDLPNAQEKNRSYKEASQERSKIINSNINNTTAVLQRLMDIFSDILSKITSMNMSIIR